MCDGREELKTAAADEGFIRVALLAIGRHRSQEEIVHWLLWALFNVVRERNRFMTKQVEQSMSEAPRVKVPKVLNLLENRCRLFGSCV